MDSPAYHARAFRRAVSDEFKRFGNAVPQRISRSDVAVTNVADEFVKRRLSLRNRDVDA